MKALLRILCLVVIVESIVLLVQSKNLFAYNGETLFQLVSVCAIMFVNEWNRG